MFPEILGTIICGVVGGNLIARPRSTQPRLQVSIILIVRLDGAVNVLAERDRINPIWFDLEARSR